MPRPVTRAPRRLAGTALALSLALGLGACGDAEAAPVAHAVPPATAAGEPPAPPAAPAPAPASTARTVLWIGGDVLTSDAVRDDARTVPDPRDGFARIFAPITAEWARDGDDAFVLVNMESPTARVVRNERLSALSMREERGWQLAPIRLNAPQYVLGGLSRGGVDAVMLANNHALDQDREGLAETLDAAGEAGLLVSGAGRAPDVRRPITVGEEGARTAVLTFYDGRQGSPRLDPGDAGLSMLDGDAPRLVREAAGTHDAVVVVAHVLGELLRRPKPAWRVWARALAEAGADAIIVHGTHIVNPVERWQVGDREVLVAWGVGNFLTDMGRQTSPRRGFARDMPKTQDPRVKVGLLARVEVTPDGVRTSFLPTWMHDTRLQIWARLTEQPIRFSLLPLAACGEPTPLPGWEGELREEMLAWIAERRDHALARAGLDTRGCVPGEVTRLVAGAPLGPPPEPAEDGAREDEDDDDHGDDDDDGEGAGAAP